MRRTAPQPTVSTASVTVDSSDCPAEAGLATMRVTETLPTCDTGTASVVVEA